MLQALEDIAGEVRRAPMLRAAASFMAGLVVARSIEPSIAMAWITGGCAAIIAWMLVRRYSYELRWMRGALLVMAMFGLGLLWWALRDPLGGIADAGNSRGHLCLVQLSEASYSGERSSRFEALILTDTLSTSPLVDQRLLVTLAYDSGAAAPSVGDRVLIDADPHRIDRVPDPGGFDLRAYAGSRGVALEVFVPADDWRYVSHRARWTDVFAGARTNIARWLKESGLPERERALAKALLIGVKDELGPDQKAAFVRSGTMHVLAVSGAHVGIIWAVLNALLSRLGNSRRPRIVRGCIILLALWAYAGLTGAEASVLRATVMCSLFTLGNMVLRAAGHMNSLFAAALVLLLWDSMMLWQLSFQLSFMAVLGIILFYKPLLHLWHAPNWLMHQVWSAATISLAAQLTTTPLSLLVFKSFPVWFLPANIAVAFIVAAAVYGSALLVVFFKVPVLGALLTWCMTKLLLVLGGVTAFFGALPAAYPGIRIDLVQCLLLYLFIACCTAWIAWPGRFSRWATACTLVAVLITWGVKAHRLDRTTRFAVHASGRDRVISLQSGRDLALFANMRSPVHPATLRGFEAQQRAMGADHAQLFHRNELLGGRTGVGTARVDHGIVQAGRSRIAITGPETEAHRAPLIVDQLVLDDPGPYDMDALMSAITPRSGVVLSSAVDGLESHRIRKWCAARSIACYDVKRQGAFILEETR